MTNPYYNHTTYPTTGSSGSSALLRAEFDAVTAGFNMLPALAGNANGFVVVKPDASGLEVTTAGVFSSLTSGGSPVWTAASLTNLNQLTNGPGFITSAALAGYAPILSPALGGTPTAPTAAAGTNTTQLATTAFVLGQGFITSAGNAASASSVPWTGVTGKPTTLSGYGITDAYSSTNPAGYITSAGTSAACSGNAATASAVSMSAARTDAAAYPVVWGTTGSTSQLYSCSAVTIQSSTGTLSASQVTATSDERVKANWRDTRDNFVESLASVRAGVFDRTDCDLTQIGVSAQSLRGVMPEAVVENADGMLSIDSGPAAMYAVVKLARRVLELEARLGARA
jgi:hypothetical protein